MSSTARPPIRLTVVLTHPVQYYSPWFRYIAANEPALALTVLYATSPDERQQGVGFDAPFAWDVPLTGGYEALFARSSSDSDRFDAGSFRGVDVPDIGKTLMATRPDAVLLPGWQSITLVRALIAARRRGVPVIYRGDTHLGTAPEGWRHFAWRAKTWSMLRQFSAWLAVGVRARDYLMDFGVDHRMVFSAPHAVDNALFDCPHGLSSAAWRRLSRQRFGLDEKTFTIAFVGKLDDNKDPLSVIRAAARLSQPINVLIAGAGPLAPEVRREAESLRVSARFAGFVNQSQLAQVYGAADCVAVPSRSETWGLVVNEAFAAGVPVVASDRVGCVPDLIDDTTGAIFAVGDDEAFATAIDSVRAKRVAADSATSCRVRAAKYGIRAATDGLVAACRRVTSQRTEPVPPVRVVACCGNMVTVTGLERHTFETLRALRERGAAVHCIVNSWEHHRITPLADAIGATWSVGAYRFPLRRRRVSPRQFARMLLEIVQTSRGLLRDVRRTRATAVIIPDHVVTLRNAWALAWFRIRGNVKIVAQLGNAPDPGRFYRRYWRWLQSPLSDHFVANSRFTAAELLASGIRPRKISHVYNVLPPARRIGAPAPWDARIPGRIVYVGQVIPGKGADLLVEAVALLRRRGLDVSLQVVGDVDGWTTSEYRDFRKSLIARAREDDLRSYVEFLGWRDDVPELLAAASLHCAPSRPELREGFGYVTLEAKEAGIPSVVFRSGALPELVSHREDGWVCDVCSVEALAEGLEFFLRDTERLRAAGEAARLSAARFDPAAYGDFWWSVVAPIEAPVPDRRSMTVAAVGAHEDQRH